MVSTLVVKMPPAVLAPAGSVAVTDDPNHDERVQQRVDELMALAMNDDAKSLDTIWAEVFNADKEIRFGAVEALMQFGDHSMAPRLRQLAASTVDPAEKAHIIAAADFLSLPRLGEANGTTSTPQSP
jgi:HEAT repeat protein